jgi:hypothetical protein
MLNFIINRKSFGYHHNWCKGSVEFKALTREKWLYEVTRLYY